MTRSSGRWRAWVIDPRTQRRRYVSAATRAGCGEKLAALRADVDAGIEREGTIAAYVERALRRPTPSGELPRSSTLKYRRYLADFIPAWLLTLEARAVTVEQVEDALEELIATGRSRSTVGRVRGLLVTSLTIAEREGATVRNAARLASPISDGRTEPGLLTIEQALAVLDAVEGHALAGIYVVMVTVGLRRSEALGMRWDAITRGERPTLRIEWTLTKAAHGTLTLAPVTKSTESARTVYLPHRAIEAITLHGELWGSPTEYVWSFPPPRERRAGQERATPERLPHPDALRKPLARACVAAGVPVVSPHGLSRTAGAAALAASVSLRQVQDLLEHRNPRTADHYRHILECTRTRSVEGLDDVWGP